MGRTPIASLPESTRRTTADPHRRPPPPPPPHFHYYKKWYPWLVPFIIVVNIVLFMSTMYINDCPLRSNDCIGTSFLGPFAFQSTRENPLLGPSAATLLELGALQVSRVVEDHQVWRLLSCMWLHAGAFHLLANMLSLLFVGIRLEQEFGFIRIGLLYVIAGVGGSLSSALFVRTTISVGASGALFGLLGAMLSELLINWTIYEKKLESLSSLIFIIIMNLAVGILPHVDNFAHLGGFITGFLLGFILLIRPQYSYIKNKTSPYRYSNSSKSKYKTYQYILLMLSLTALILGLATGLTLLLDGVNGNDHCSWCHYLSCVPTPLWSCQSRCTSSQYENQLNLTCLDNNRTKFYLLSNQTTIPQIQRMCAELCGRA